MKTKKAARKNALSKTAALAFAFVMLIAATITLFNGNIKALPDNAGKTDIVTTEKSDHSPVNKNFLLIVANAAQATEMSVYKENNVSVPLGGILMVKDTRNMTELEINKIPHEMKVKLQALYGTESGWKIHGESGETALYFGTMDHIRLKIEDPDNVEKITLSCTVNGQLTIGDETLIASPREYIQTVKQGNGITVTGEEYKNIYGKDDGMVFDWFLSESLEDTLKAAPETPLSAVSDVITGTIRYVDGTQESFTLTLSFDDEGNLSSTYKS